MANSPLFDLQRIYIISRPSDSPRFRYVAIEIFATNLYLDKYDGDRLWELERPATSK
jgi:hypothetical protein